MTDKEKLFITELKVLMAKHDISGVMIGISLTLTDELLTFGTYPDKNKRSICTENLFSGFVGGIS